MKKFLPILFFLATLGYADSKTDTTIVPKKTGGVPTFDIAGAANTNAAPSGCNVNSTNSAHSHVHSLTAAKQGHTGDLETRPVNANVNYIIKI